MYLISKPRNTHSGKNEKQSFEWYVLSIEKHFKYWKLFKFEPLGEGDYNPQLSEETVVVGGKKTFQSNGIKKGLRNGERQWREACLKYGYTKAQGLENKQEEVELCIYLQSYTVVGITWMYWGRLAWPQHYNRYRLFRRHREDGGSLSSTWRSSLNRWSSCIG